MVSGLLVSKGAIVGVKTSLGLEIKARAVVLTNGTFLNGLIHIGEKQFGGGRAGEKASTGITEELVDYGFKSGRMKTGTPPRVDGRSLNYSVMSKQPGDINPGKFSFSPSTHPLKKQLDCHMTHTSPEVHELLKEGFDRSPMFNGSINSIGPRYCPSIEDKINRFANKQSHQIFVEPEGWNTVEVYVNGFSTSLPEDIQFRALSSVKGFENVKFFRPGYAIEYDYFPPTQLKNSLETKPVSGLFFAGQINGTTGYEEAAAQGLMAGINAHLKINHKPPFILRRNEAYIGVLIDDLITKGTDEPYRMFTSRAEYRTLLRQDNADLRLTELSYNLGLASAKSLNLVNKKRKDTKDFVSFFQKTSVKPETINPILKKNKSSEIKQSVKLYKIFSRPNISLDEISTVPSVKDFVLSNNYDKGVLEQTEVQVKYSGYIDKEKANAEKLNNLENIKIPSSFSYSKVSSLSTEAVQKLEEIRPTSLSQASRISGVSPNDISVLMVYMGR